MSAGGNRSGPCAHRPQLPALQPPARTRELSAMDPINPAQIPNSHLVKSASIHIHAIMAGARFQRTPSSRQRPTLRVTASAGIRRL